MLRPNTISGSASRRTEEISCCARNGGMLSAVPDGTRPIQLVLPSTCVAGLHSAVSATAGLPIIGRGSRIEGVRLVKPPRVTSERYLSTWKDVSTWPAHPKEGEHAAIWESAAGAPRRQWRKGVRRSYPRKEQPLRAGNDSRRHAQSRETQARRDCLQCNGADGP